MIAGVTARRTVTASQTRAQRTIRCRACGAPKPSAEGAQSTGAEGAPKPSAEGAHSRRDGGAPDPCAGGARRSGHGARHEQVPEARAGRSPEARGGQAPEARHSQTPEARQVGPRIHRRVFRNAFRRAGIRTRREFQVGWVRSRPRANPDHLFRRGPFATDPILPFQGQNASNPRNRPGQHSGVQVRSTSRKGRGDPRHISRGARDKCCQCTTIITGRAVESR